MVVGLVPTPALAQIVNPTPLLEEVTVDPGDSDLGDAESNELQQTIMEPTATETVDPVDEEPAVETQSDDTAEKNDSIGDLVNDPSSDTPIDDSIDVEIQSTNDISTGNFKATFADDGSLQYAVDYTGEPVELPAVHINLMETDTTGPIALIEDTDFEFDHYTDGAYNDLTQAPTEPGPYYAVYQGIGNYTGTCSVFFRIVGYDEISHRDYSVDWIHGNAVAYTGEPVSAPPARIYRWSDTEGSVFLTQDMDFEVAAYYDADHQELDGSPVQIGTYYVQYRGIYPKFNGLREAEFLVCDPNDLSSQYWNFYFDGDPTIISTGTPVQLSGLIVYNGIDEVTLREGTDFAIDHYETEDGTDIGTVAPSQSGVYYAVYKGIRPYRNTIKVWFQVRATNDLAYAKIRLQNSALPQTGNFVQLEPKVRDAFGLPLTKGTDYVLEYYDSNKEPCQVPTLDGTYYVAARAMQQSAYVGVTKLVQFTIGDQQSQDPDPGTNPDPGQQQEVSVDQVMSLNKQYNAQTQFGTFWVGQFTAPKSGIYTFASTGESDTVGYLFADKYCNQMIADDDDSGEDTNFRIDQELAAGQTVYLKIGECEGGISNSMVSVTAVNEYDLSLARLELYSDSLDTTSHLLYPTASVYSVAGTFLVEGTDYELVYYREDNGTYQVLSGTPTVAGRYQIMARAKAGSPFQGQTARHDFVAKDARDLSTLGTLNLEGEYCYEDMGYEQVPVYLYTEEAVTPSVMVMVGGTVLTSSNYTVSYQNNNAEGVGTVTVTGKGAYTGSLSKKFKLTSKLDFASYADHNHCTISALGMSLTFYGNDAEILQFTSNGFPMDPQVTFYGGIFDGLDVPVQGRDFEVSFTDSQGTDILAPSDQGTYNLMLTATQTGNLTGSITIPFSITNTRDLVFDRAYPSLAAPDSSCYSQSYNAGGDTYNIYDPLDAVADVVFSLRDGTVALIENLDYAVSCVQDTLLGLWVYTFTGMGSYEGTVASHPLVNTADDV